jgi:hypothetical protein
MSTPPFNPENASMLEDILCTQQSSIDNALFSIKEYARIKVIPASQVERWGSLPIAATHDGCLVFKMPEGHAPEGHAYVLHPYGGATAYLITPAE